jgi:hypothetical protein
VTLSGATPELVSYQFPDNSCSISSAVNSNIVSSFPATTPDGDTVKPPVCLRIDSRANTWFEDNNGLWALNIASDTLEL